MRFQKFLLLANVALLFLLAGCGGDATPELGAFPDIKKTEGDASFALVAPQSKSSAPFSFASSNPAIATVSGNSVTILLAGTTTITASQAADGAWGRSSTSAVLTVAEIKCSDPLVRDSGKCVVPCVAPATRQNGVCVATPLASAKFVVIGATTWMPAVSLDTWANAKAFCAGTKINEQTGWRLPQAFEIDALYASGLMNGQGWTLAKTWSSTAGTNAANQLGHLTTDLSSGAKVGLADDSGAYVSCVR